MFVLTLLSVFQQLVLIISNFHDAFYDLKNDSQDAVLFPFFLDSVEGEHIIRRNDLNENLPLFHDQRSYP